MSSTPGEPEDPGARRARAGSTLALTALTALTALALALALAPPVLARTAPLDASAQLAAWWDRSFDTTEELVVSHASGLTLAPEGSQERVHTLVVRVDLPWLAPVVLYLEEFPHDDPARLRRQVLLVPRPVAVAAGRVAVDVEQYTFREPARFSHLDQVPARLRELRRADLDSLPGCTLRLELTGSQFRGGTRGRRCRDRSGAQAHYVDYRMVIGPELYWYRRRLVRASNGRTEEEIAGFDHFEPLEARLFTCHVRRSGGEPELASVDLPDQGGKATVELPGGARLELELHGRDWPFAFGRDALILIVRRPGEPKPLITGWTGIDARAIGLDVDGLRIDCAPVVPEPKDLRAAAGDRMLVGGRPGAGTTGRLALKSSAVRANGRSA